MEIDCPEFLRKLCARDSILPLSHYVQRSPWGLREDNFEKAFAGTMGLYCFWWSGPAMKFLNQLAKFEKKGEHYPGPTSMELGHDLIPAYVGMTINLANRIRLRLVQIAGHMEHWLTKESRLIKLPKLAPLSGTSTNFRVFEYPERIRSRVASMTGKQDMTLAAAQDFIVTRTPHCRDLIAEFQEDYYSLLFDNYSTSFVPFADESDLFYAEALSIGLLRPPFNHT
jgi:hypothetical protein